MESLCAILTAAGADPEAWTGNPSHHDRGRAAQACRVCPVRAACLEDALLFESASAQYRQGIWGGLSEEDRAALSGEEWEEAA